MNLYTQLQNAKRSLEHALMAVELATPPNNVHGVYPQALVDAESDLEALIDQVMDEFNCGFKTSFNNVETANRLIEVL